MGTIASRLYVYLSKSAYRAAAKAVVRGLWLGVIDYTDAFGQFFDLIHGFYDKAWREGAAEVGIKGDELTEGELYALEQMKLTDLGYLDPFLTFVEEHSKANGGLLKTVNDRLELWVHRYEAVRIEGKLLAGEDQKFEWQIGATKESCSSCLKLQGKVKRASYWRDSGIRPQHRDLECKGYNCDCRLVLTDKPQSKGRLPSIP